MEDLCAKFIEDYSKPKNRPRTVESNQGYIDCHIIPRLGILKVRAVTRSDVSSLITRMKKTPVTANRVLSCLRKMFNMAEVWGVRDDSTNPCGHIPKYPENGKTRLITDDEMVRLFSYLERADLEGAGSTRSSPSGSVCSSPLRRACRRSPAWNGTGSSTRIVASSGQTAIPEKCRSP